MKKISLFTLKTIVIIVLAILSFVLFSYIHLSMIRSGDLRKQNKRMDKINNYYDEDKSYSYLDYSSENLDDKPLNEVKFLASHNSYKKSGSLIGRLFVGLGDSFKEAKSMKYEYKNITEQLQQGIYSFEFDLRLRGKKFEVTHVPIVDNSSTMVDFEQGLKEIKFFLDKSGNSFPLVIILEIKDDYTFLDRKLKSIKSEDLINLEDLIKTIFEDKVYTTSDMLGNYSSLMDRVNDIGWPKIDELKNKALFVLHAGKHADTFSDPNYSSKQVLFTSTYGDLETSDSPFIIHNSLDVKRINELVDKGYIVRTRIGDTLGFTDSDFKKALDSNAQILTSDFTIARKNISNHLYLEDKKYTIKGRN